MKATPATRYLSNLGAGLLLWAASLSAFADYSSTVLSKNPIGYWQLNETNPIPALAVATNYGSLAAVGNGVFLNGATTEPTPIAGSAGETAAKFDGLSQKVQVPYNSALNPTNELSVEAWVRPECIDTWNNTWARAVVSTFGGNAQGGGYKLMFNAGTTTTPDVFKFTLWNGTSGTETFAASTTVGTILATNNGPWFHMVGTWSSTDGIAHLYVNGVELATASRSYNPTTSSPLRIGATDTDPTDPVGASMDPGPIAHVAVYSTALDITKVLAHYQAGTNAAVNYSTTISADSPVGYWKLNETGFPAMPVATNLGSKGAALNGTYCYASTPGVAGPLPPNYDGFQSTNTAVYTTNTLLGGGGFVFFPPMRSPGDSNILTVVAWIKRDGSQMAAANIFGRRINSYAKSAFGFDGGGLNKLSYNWDDNASQYNFDTKLTVPNNVWTLAAWVLTPTNTVIYMDTGTGLQVVTNAFANTTTLGLVHQVFIGTTGGNYQGRRFNGSVEEVAVFTNALAAADIWDLRNAAFGSGLFIASEPVGRPVMLGGKAPFTCIAAGSTNYMPFSYQLLKNGAPVGSAGSSSTVILSNIQPADLTGNFSISVLTNGAASGSLTSSVVGLTRWTVPGEYSEIVESYGPAAYYRFSETNGTTVYEIAQAFDGFTVGAISRTSGPVPTDFAGFQTNNNAYNGNGGYIPVGGPAISGSNVTIAMWVNPSSSVQIPYSGLYYSRGADYAGFNYGPAGNTELGISWNVHYNDHSLVFAEPGVWNFIAVVLGDITVPSGITNAATFYCYTVGGGWQSNSIYGAGGFPERNLAGGQGTAIGTDSNTGLNRPVKGMIDEVVVINKTLSFDDINKLAMAGVNTHVSIQPAGGNDYNVGWSYGTLQSSPTLFGPWASVGGAIPPAHTISSTTSTQQFFRVVP